MIAIRYRYQAIHYTVSLNLQRLALPEYAAFSGMRCEIQIQTILNHAWAESSHDILYKPPASKGFGSKAMQSIDQRMKRIMDDFLLPAGYELQKVQHDFSRLKQGKGLFDRGVIESLNTCTNNNDMHEVLSTIQQYVLPYYDDVTTIYPELRRALLKAFDDSRETETVEIKTPFGNLPGKTLQDITSLITDILGRLRYVDVGGAFSALFHLYRHEQDINEREGITYAVKELAEYNLTVWQKVGPGAQMILTQTIDRLNPAEWLEFRHLLLTVWHEVLSPEMKDTSFGAETVTLRRGSLVAIDEVKQVRRSAIDGALDLLDRVPSEPDKTRAINTVRAATQLPSMASYSNELCSLVLTDTLYLAQQLTRRIPDLPYQLLAHIENYFLFDYQRAREIAEADEDRIGCKQLAGQLLLALRSFRDAVNRDLRFVRFKTLVGFSSVFQQQWDIGKHDYIEVDEYRKAKIVEYVNEITTDNENEWFALIDQCAATKSADLATFPIFAAFIVALAKEKPHTARRLWERAGADLLTFLAAFLGGLGQSGAQDIYEGVIADHLAKGTYLAGLARHWRLTQPDRPIFIHTLLEQAIGAVEDDAVIECVAGAVAGHGTPNQPPLDALFGRAMRYLAQRPNYWWIHEVWYLPQVEAFFSMLPVDIARIVLSTLLAAPKIGHETERILSCIAVTHDQLVWDFLAQRINATAERDQNPSYDAIPYEFHGLEKPLSKNAELAVATVRRLFGQDDHLFEFGGARLLSEVFPTCPVPFVAEFSRLVANGSDEDIEFTIKVLRSYRGKPVIHGLVRHIIVCLPEDDPRLPQVEICLDTTGLVSGQFGFVDAFRARKTEIAFWLNDEDIKVRAFAARFITRLEGRIASEQRSAEERMELRKREYETDGSDAE